MARFVALGMICLLIGGCEDTKLTDAKTALARRLKDPSSLQIRDVRPCDKPNAIQGEYNAKNSFGAYVGFKPFIFAEYDVATLADQGGLSMEDSLDHWNELTKKCWSDEVLANISYSNGFVIENIDAIAPVQTDGTVEK